jgi:hypothetical protein
VRLETALRKPLGHADQHHDRPDGQVWLQARHDDGWCDIRTDVAAGAVVRSLHKAGPVFPVVWAADRIRWLDAGMVDCLPKPTAVDEPVQVLQRWARRGALTDGCLRKCGGCRPPPR